MKKTQVKKPPAKLSTEAPTPAPIGQAEANVDASASVFSLDPKTQQWEPVKPEVVEQPQEEDFIKPIQQRTEDLVTELFWLFADTLTAETQTPEEERVLTALLKRRFWVTRKAVEERVFLIGDYFALWKHHLDINQVRSGAKVQPEGSANPGG
jgi:hypothetical protein